ncbi:MAG: hypothetical protein J6S36_04585 [Eggerthellaceae bacterium]|nr:hypothetical protein [Eggerthellaceae bacterium]
MLFVLTGQVQTGKTRWLEELVAALEEAGVATYGVLAPGVWADRRGNPEAFPHADANGFEKLGIDNVLLPEGQRIAFARRADLAEASGEHDPNSQSSQAKLHWSISDAAIKRVNGHFADLRTRAQAHDDTTGGFLIVDELGQLELLRGGGLTEAVGILQDGPTALTRHALVVVREALLAHLDGRFSRWGQIELVNPDKPSQSRILATLTESR